MRNALLGSAACAFVLQVTPALAQDAEGDDASDEVYTGDIVVTANRTESLLSKTPIALTAIGGDQLAQEGITNPTQLEESVPNLSIVRGNGLQITIRGVTSTDGTEKGDPSAAFNVNGVYIARPQAQEVSFYDIERIEVLRGPQGTLYGRNSTAGVVNLLTTRPKFEFGASADVSYDNYTHLFATGVINVPLGDTFALRVAGNVDRRDSFVINGSGDGYDYDPYNNNKSVRVSALWEPNSDVTLFVVGDYSTLKGTRVGSVETTNFFRGASPVTNPAATRPNRPIYYNSSADAQLTNRTPQLWEPYNNNADKGIMGELNWNFGAATFTYLGSYRESTRESHSTIIGGLNRATFDGDYWQTSHEARLAFGGDGPLNAQIGAYYFKEKSGIAFFILDPQTLGFPPFATQFGFPQDPTIAENKSVFGQATYEIAPDLKLTGGIRYSNDDKSRVGATVFDTDPAVMIPGNRVVLQINDAEATFSKVTWRAGIDYDSPVGLIFASVATGYKAGGFNDGCLEGPDAPPECVYDETELFYQPENITAYELGGKFRISDEFSLNATLFHYDYKGLQLSQVGDFGGCGSCQLTTNAAKATVDGIELESVISPVENLTFNLSANYLDAKYKDYTPSRVVGDDIITLNFAGHPLARSPKYTWAAAVNYTYWLANDGKIDFNLGTRFSSSYSLTDIANLIDYYQPSFTKTDASVRYTAPDDKFYFAAFVENIENEVALTSAGYGTFGFDGAAAFADPRLYGVRAGFKF